MVLPSLLHHEVLTLLHQEHGHQGVERTTELVRQRCYWPGLTSDVVQCVKSVTGARPPTTGKSPYFFMFGQEPRLPVDFLLGRVQEVGVGSVHEWMREHQSRLQVAFEGAQGQLETAAGRRKAQYNAHVRDAPLREGQLVYLREYGVRGRHKVQDL